MADHKYAAGDRVTLLPDRNNANQGCQYRAKSVLDSHERVLDEAQLRSA